MFAAKETFISAQRGRVWAFEQMMFASVYHGGFFLGKCAPQEEHDVGALVADQLDHGVRHLLPTLALVRIGFGFLDGEASVEEQDALLSPTQ